MPSVSSSVEIEPQPCIKERGGAEDEEGLDDHGEVADWQWLRRGWLVTGCPAGSPGPRLGPSPRDSRDSRESLDS